MEKKINSKSKKEKKNKSRYGMKEFTAVKILNLECNLIL